MSGTRSPTYPEWFVERAIFSTGRVGNTSLNGCRAYVGPAVRQPDRRTQRLHHAWHVESSSGMHIHDGGSAATFATAKKRATKALLKACERSR